LIKLILVVSKTSLKRNNLIKYFEASNRGLVVKADGSQSSGRGFKPWHHILDGCKLLHKENGNKGSQMGRTKYSKKFFKNLLWM
jgi:hypothetical protein